MNSNHHRPAENPLCAPLIFTPQEAQGLVWRALKMNDAPLLALLLVAGANAQSMTDKWNPSRMGASISMLCHACDCFDQSSPDCIEVLISAGASLAGPRGTTLPLHYLLGSNASPRQATESMAVAVTLLIAHGADPNARASHDDTPLRLALHNLRGPHRTGVIKALLSHGAFFEINGGAELDVALRSDEIQPPGAEVERRATVQALISHGARHDSSGRFTSRWLLNRCEQDLPTALGLLASRFEQLEIAAHSTAPAALSRPPRI